MSWAVSGKDTRSGAVLHRGHGLAAVVPASVSDAPVMMACKSDDWRRLVEGLEVLYGSNTLRISAVPIIYNLPLFVSPTQLDQIISLDLDLYVEKEFTTPITKDAASPFVNSLALPPAADFSFPFLPSLRYLHLAVERHYDLNKLHGTYNAAAVIKAYPNIEDRRRRKRKMIESELLVQDALANLMRNRTTFVIAHRLSTVRRADLIIALEKGRVAEIGTHDDLVDRPGGVYARLYALQAFDDRGRGVEEEAPGGVTS